jgi:hypothetical protein
MHRDFQPPGQKALSRKAQGFSSEAIHNSVSCWANISVQTNVTIDALEQILERLKISMAEISGDLKEISSPLKQLGSLLLKDLALERS